MKNTADRTSCHLQPSLDHNFGRNFLALVISSSQEAKRATFLAATIFGNGTFVRSIKKNSRRHDVKIRKKQVSTNLDLEI